MTSIYHTPQGEAAIHEIYHRQVASLGVPVEHRNVPTRYGNTHLLITGPADGHPLVVFHGGNSLNPISLSWFLPLAANGFRIYAPDTIGHPGRSAAKRLSPRDNSYGLWAADVLDSLELEQARFIGPSYGAGIVLRLASIFPERILKASLVVPSGFVKPAMGPMIRQLVIPMLAYRLSPSPERLVATLAPLAGQPNPQILESTALIFQHVRVEAEMPRAVSAQELARLHAPVQVIAAERDILFPGERVVARARQVVPNLIDTYVIAGSPHFLPPEVHPQVVDRISRFLSDNV
jgi:pimeloyl-ACP methyl ester carboxylesterase